MASCSPLKLRRSYVRSLGWSSLKACMEWRQSPCAHYLPITDQLLWSHSSRLQIRTASEAYSSTSRLREAQEESRAISPPGRVLHSHTTSDRGGQQQTANSFFNGGQTNFEERDEVLYSCFAENICNLDVGIEGLVSCHLPLTCGIVDYSFLASG